MKVKDTSFFDPLPAGRTPLEADLLREEVIEDPRADAFVQSHIGWAGGILKPSLKGAVLNDQRRAPKILNAGTGSRSLTRTMLVRSL